jgi:hypothetical protein
VGGVAVPVEFDEIARFSEWSAAGITGRIALSRTFTAEVPLLGMMRMRMN